MSQKNNPFVEFLDRYRNDPVLFVQEVFGVDPDAWQADFLRAIARGERRISVRSGHGVGKSCAAAWAVIWFMLTRIDFKIVITAPTSDQLFDALFAEIKAWIHKLPKLLGEYDQQAGTGRFKVMSDRVEMIGCEERAFLSARTSRADKPEALAGVHAEHVMLIADEASGVPEQVFESAYGSMSSHNAVTILLGNPVRGAGLFFDTHHRLSDRWHTMHVPCTSSSRVSEEFIRDIRDRYGDESNVYRVRVLGEFPRSEDDTVIPLELVESAVMRDIEPAPNTPVVWGLDVARFGDDSSCLVKRKGNIITEDPRTWKNLDTMQTAGVVQAEWESTPESMRPAEIMVDAIGLGAGVADRLIHLGLPARAVNVSELPALKGNYGNLRAELWFKAKAWFEARNCRIPKHEGLRAELTIVRYGFRAGSSKLLIEEKSELKKRLRRSPDVADAFCLTFASDAGTALYGASSMSTWGKKLKMRWSIV